VFTATVLLHPNVLAQGGQLPDAAATTFRAGVETVVVSVTVRDSSNQLVTTLGRDDFRLFVDGRAVKVDVFSLERRPLLLGILLSTSSESGVARMRDIGRALVDAIEPGEYATIGTYANEIAITPFATSDHLVLTKSGLASMGMGWIPLPGLLLGLDKAFLPLLGPRDDLRIASFAGQRITFSRAASTAPARLAAFREVITPDVVPLTDFYGASPVWDAVAAASRQLPNDLSFRSIVLVTDGQASGNRIGHAEAIAAAASRGVVVHVVGRKSQRTKST
jgi:hypothetical protein